jgi:hypothetical protein
MDRDKYSRVGESELVENGKLGSAQDQEPKGILIQSRAPCALD